jgi:hypothetical protein
MSSIDKAYENYYNYKSSDRDYILNVNGYEPAEKNIFEKAYDVIKPGGTFETKVQPVIKDMGKGAARGVVKLTEGVTTLIAAGAEKFILGPEALAKLDPEGDGIVKDIGEFYKRNVYDKIGDTETLAGGLTEGLAQFIVPGVGYYKLFNGLIKAKGMLPFITRALAAETATVGTAQVAGDPNFVSFIAETFDIETKDAETIASRYFEYLRTPEDVTDGVTADEVLAEKWKAIQGDIVLGPVGEALGPLLTKFFSGVKKMKKGTFNKIDKKTLDEINTKTISGTATKSEIATSLFNIVKNRPEGFSVTINGKTPQELGYSDGFMVAPTKKTEIVFDAKSFNDTDIDQLLDNVEALEQTLDGRYAEVYAGGWLEKGKYYLDASVRIDNLDDALYIAKGGNQLGIFDLKELKSIDTEEGLTKLKESGSYSSAKELDKRTEAKAIDKGFEKARLEIQNSSPGLNYRFEGKARSAFTVPVHKQNLSLVSTEPKDGIPILHDMYVEQMNIIKSIINNPEKEITIYRVVPKNIKNAKINSGDYVALTKKLAGVFGEPKTEQMLEMKVKAKDVYTKPNSKTGAAFIYKGGTK